MGAYVAPGRENETAGCSAQRNKSSNTSPPSAGFKLMLTKLVPKLRAAFEDNANVQVCDEQEGVRGCMGK